MEVCYCKKRTGGPISLHSPCQMPDICFCTRPTLHLLSSSQRQARGLKLHRVHKLFITSDFIKDTGLLSLAEQCHGTVPVILSDSDQKSCIICLGFFTEAGAEKEQGQKGSVNYIRSEDSGPA